MNITHTPHGIRAVIPVKSFDQAKNRLSAVLNDEQRRQLCRAMLGDVLAATTQAKNISGVLVVTCEPEAMELAKQYSADVLVEDASCGLCEAVAAAGRYLSAQGCAGLINIPGDVPLVSADEIDGIISAHGTSPAVTLVPAWDGGGTNALVVTPADVIELCFGEGSFSAHQEAAHRSGLTPTIISSNGLELDLDTPDDLTAFMKVSSQTRTARYLASIHYAEQYTANLNTPVLKRGLG